MKRWKRFGGCCLKCTLRLVVVCSRFAPVGAPGTEWLNGSIRAGSKPVTRWSSSFQRGCEGILLRDLVSRSGVVMCSGTLAMTYLNQCSGTETSAQSPLSISAALWLWMMF